MRHELAFGGIYPVFGGSEATLVLQNHRATKGKEPLTPCIVVQIRNCIRRALHVVALFLPYCMKDTLVGV